MTRIISQIFSTAIFLPILTSIYPAASVKPLPAPYQVAIRLAETYVEGDTGVTNLCNGVIISPEYILTTAGCVHMPTPWSTVSRPILPASLYIVAGNFTISSNDGGIKRNVVSVIVHDKFNPTNLTNDIALLKLDAALTFDANNVNWIDLQQQQNGTNGEYKCYINPQNSLGHEVDYPYSVVPNISLVDLWFCSHNRTTLKPTEAYPEVCLLHTTMNRFLCNGSEPLRRYSSERGTSLVCNNRISGLLSAIHEPMSLQNCLTSGKLFGTYTSVPSFVPWIKAKTSLWANSSDVPIPPSWSESQPAQSPNKPSSANGRLHQTWMSIFLLFMLFKLL